MNEEQQHALVAVIQSGNMAGLRKMLADDPSILQIDWGEGKTWLHMAAGDDNPDLLAEFVDAGLDIDTPLANRPETPLHAALTMESWKAAEWLIKHGANVNACGDNYPTPLSIAAESDNLDIVKLLLSYGANINTCHGQPPENPLSLAIFYEEPEIERFLRANGALLPGEMPGGSDKKQENIEFLENLQTEIGKLYLHSRAEDGTVEVWVSPPNSNRDSFILATSGVRALEMSPPDPKHPRRVELLLELPSNWQFIGEAGALKQFRWPIEWLRLIANSILEKRLTIYEWNTQAGEDPTEPLGPGVEMSAFLYVPVGGVTMADGQEIGLLTLFPIYKEELDCISKQGTAALLRAFQAARVPVKFSPGRPNALAGKRIS
jgi:hypothetical protein